MQIVAREDISITKKELRARFVDTASIPGEGRRDDESCDTDGIIDIDFRFDAESVDSELSIDLDETLEEEIAEEDEISHKNGVEEPREKAHAKKGKDKLHSWTVCDCQAHQSSPWESAYGRAEMRHVHFFLQ